MSETIQRRADDISEWNRSLPGEIHLELVRTADERVVIFRNFLEAFTALATNVTFSETGGGAGGMPFIRLKESWTFHMVPEGKELDPFLSLLGAVAGEKPGDVPPVVKKKLDEIQTPSLIDIFISTLCPGCPAVVRRLSLFPLVNRLIRVKVVDVGLFYDMAEEASVGAVPTVFIAGGQRFTGLVSQEDIADGLIHGDPSKMSTGVFAAMIRAGDAGSLAGMMVRSGRVFPGVVELLAGDLLPLRLGAMVAMEGVAEKSPRMALEALDQIWTRIEGASFSARGDMIYLIGEFGDSGWIPSLEGLLKRESSPELREVLEEAISSIRLKQEKPG